MQFFLDQSLKSIQAACKNITFEIIVVDNNSSDGSCDMIEQKFPSIRMIKNRENVGFSRANNQGVAKAIGEYILILNPDTILAEDTLEKVLRFADTKKNVGVVGVHFIDGSGKLLPECKRNIPTLKIATEKLFGKSINYYASQIEENSIAKVAILSGAFMLIKRSIFNEVEGFDEDYFMFGEDIDLCYKIVNAGYQNYYFGESTVLHYKGESTVKDISYLKNFYGAMQLFYKKHFDENRILNLVGKIVIKGFVSFKSLQIKKVKDEIKEAKKTVLISENREMLKKIANDSIEEAIKIESDVPDNLTSFDMIIFDNEYLSNRDIINAFKSLEHTNISKRIIPKNSDFYLGSDSSIIRGEVIPFIEG